MAQRHLFGEKITDMYEVTGPELSEVLSEASLLVRDLESNSTYLRLVQQWDEENDFIVLIYVHTT